MAKNKTLEALLEDYLGVSTHPEILPAAVSTGLAAVQLVPNNPNRVNLNFINLSANTVYIWTTPGVSANLGILLAPNGGTFGLEWFDDMTLVMNEWWALATGAGANVAVIGVVTQ